ncbi:MAG TPA: hypothetical protein VMS74_10430 [Acidimicrobiia bacterium]|nr:hypothetical protein [Acidimicrobiia bacterium]
MTDQQQPGLTRREMLKRGAIFGGAVIWATPVVQTVGMNRALAQEASPGCTVWYAIKINIDGASFECESIDGQAENDPGWGDGKCLDVASAEADGGFTTVDFGGTCPVDTNLILVLDANTWVVTLPETCEFEGSFAIKVGSGQSVGCQYTGASYDATNREITFSVDTANAISHVEFIICCA